jgi:3-isopropylmalate/(R)-2-methylmalate dehydratase small subunit
MDKFTGKVWVLGDDIDTDIIIPTEYLALKTVDDMKKYAFSPLRPELAGQIGDGDIIVAGKNFGCGSSREQAPSVLKALGIKAVYAKSFARIFYRNSINIGLPVLVCEDLHDNVAAGDEADIDLTAGTVKACGKEFTCTKLPEYMQNILNAGGLIASLNKEEN